MLSLSITYYACLFVELVYPTYASYKAIQSLAPEDDTQWLTYWTVYAFLSTLESLFTLVFQWVPLYYEFKLLFIIWMIAPQTKGAKLLYDQYIKPMLVKHASKIDPVFASTDSMLQSRYTGVAAQLVEKYGPTVATEAMRLAAEQSGRLQENIRLATAAEAKRA